jgi:hypothetical protein
LNRGLVLRRRLLHFRHSRGRLLSSRRFFRRRLICRRGLLGRCWLFGHRLGGSRFFDDFFSQRLLRWFLRSVLFLLFSWSFRRSCLRLSHLIS